MSEKAQYTEDNIRSLDWKEHIRMRPGMYIGKLGDGSSPDDGIYILIKEVLDNCIDEFVMGAGKTIEIKISENQVSVRDYGRGIPLGKVVDVVSKMNTGGKYDSRAFKKSVGLNGVGTKAVNALSSCRSSRYMDRRSHISLPALPKLASNSTNTVLDASLASITRPLCPTIHSTGLLRPRMTTRAPMGGRLIRFMHSA